MNPVAWPRAPSSPRPLAAAHKTPRSLTVTTADSCCKVPASCDLEGGHGLLQGLGFIRNYSWTPCKNSLAAAHRAPLARANAGCKAPLLLSTSQGREQHVLPAITVARSHPRPTGPKGGEGVTSRLPHTPLTPGCFCHSAGGLTPAGRSLAQTGILAAGARPAPERGTRGAEQEHSGKGPYWFLLLWCIWGFF